MIKKSYITKAIASLFFIISYCFGFILGTIVVRFGLSSLFVNDDIVDEDMEEEIRRMNDMGPNN